MRITYGGAAFMKNCTVDIDSSAYLGKEQLRRFLLGFSKLHKSA
jgi:hypothetical protein